MAKRTPKPTPQKTAPIFKTGDRVRIVNSASGWHGPIVELRGPLGPGGAQIYRILIGRKPKSYIEVREDQLKLLPPKPALSPEAVSAAKKILDGMDPEIKKALRKQLREEVRAKKRGWIKQS